jgi:hypothetical protein
VGNEKPIEVKSFSVNNFVDDKVINDYSNIVSGRNKINFKIGHASVKPTYITCYRGRSSYNFDELWERALKQDIPIKYKDNEVQFMINAVSQISSGDFVYLNNEGITNLRDGSISNWTNFIGEQKQ